MTTIRSLHKRPAVFRLPSYKKVHTVPSMNYNASTSSRQRIEDNTPVLRDTRALIDRIDAFLRGTRP
jgi:hypothetical protein